MLRVVFLWFGGCLSPSVCGIQPAFISSHGAGSVLTLWVWKWNLSLARSWFLCIAADDARAQTPFRHCWEERSCLDWGWSRAVVWCCVLDQTSSGMGVCCFQNFFCWSNLKKLGVRGVRQQPKEVSRFAPELQISSKKPKQTNRKNNHGASGSYVSSSETWIFISLFFFVNTLWNEVVSFSAVVWWYSKSVSGLLMLQEVCHSHVLNSSGLA